MLSPIPIPIEIIGPHDIYQLTLKLPSNSGYTLIGMSQSNRECNVFTLQTISIARSFDWPEPMRRKSMRQHSNQHQPRPLFTTPVHTIIRLERNSGLPLYRQICQRLREAILSGELAEGVRLPTERTLASELGVNRTTVMNAYNELASEGLIEGHVGRGTLVRRNHFGYDGEHFDNVASWLFGLPAGERELLGPDARLLSDLAAMSEYKDIISLAVATPARDLLPAEMLSMIFADGLLNARQSALGYCPVEGLTSLRRGIAARMRKRGVVIDAQQILILSGSTQDIGLTGRLLLNPGDE